MIYRVENTTDKKYIGDIIEYDYTNNVITLSDGNVMNIYIKMRISEDEIRLANSNYIIDLKEV